MCDYKFFFHIILFSSLDNLNSSKLGLVLYRLLIISQPAKHLKAEISKEMKPKFSKTLCLR